MKKAILFLILTFCAGFFLQTIAQDNEPDGFIFLKSIDQVDLYYIHSLCDDGEFILIKAINTGSEQISLSLQPIWNFNNESFQSSNSIIFHLEANSEITGECDNTNLKVSIYEFFSLFDAETMSLDLIKN